MNPYPYHPEERHADKEAKLAIAHIPCHAKNTRTCIT
jgi:hypothetical protein